jgi:hypothetical protein
MGQLFYGENRVVGLRFEATPLAHRHAVHDALQAAYELGRCQVLADKQSGFPTKLALLADEPIDTRIRCEGTKRR